MIKYLIIYLFEILNQFVILGYTQVIGIILLLKLSIFLWRFPNSFGQLNCVCQLGYPNYQSLSETRSHMQAIYFFKWYKGTDAGNWVAWSGEEDKTMVMFSSWSLLVLDSALRISMEETLELSTPGMEVSNGSYL